MWVQNNHFFVSDEESFTDTQEECGLGKKNSSFKISNMLKKTVGIYVCYQTNEVKQIIRILTIQHLTFNFTLILHV